MEQSTYKPPKRKIAVNPKRFAMLSCGVHTVDIGKTINARSESRFSRHIQIDQRATSTHVAWIVGFQAADNGVH